MNKIFIQFLLFFITRSIFSIDVISNKKCIMDFENDWYFALSKNGEKPTEFKKITFPHKWKNEGIKSIGTYTGYYKKNFIVVSNLSLNQLMINLGKINDVDQCYLNGKLIGKNGQFKPRIHAKEKIRLYLLPDKYIKKGETNELLLKVGNMKNSGDGGISAKKLYIGNQELILRKNFFQILIDLMIIAILNLIGLYYFFFYIRQREIIENLFFGLFNIALSLFNISIFLNERAIGIDFILLKKIEYTSLYLMPVLIFLFFYYFYNLNKYRFKDRPIIKYLIYLITIVSLFGLSFTLVSQNYVDWRIIKRLVFFPVIAVVILVILFITFYKSFVEKESNSRITLLGIFFLTLSFLNDILKVYGIIQTPALIAYGVMALNLTLAVILVNKFVKLHNELNSLNIVLNDKVKERTEELNKTINILQKKNKRIQEEMEIAGSIQKSLLPEKTPIWNNIKFKTFYRPLEAVGGDFYDIMDLPGDKLGIMIADVSGHGVPAALITAIAKRLFSKAAEKTYSPVQIFREVNTELCESVSTQEYLTCFFITIDKEDNITCANAAHQKAIYINTINNEVKQVDTGGMFIGAIQQANNTYEEISFKLQPQDKVLLFTDCLIETKINDQGQYGVNRVIATIKENINFNIDQIIQKILDDFFRELGDNELNDDLTILGFEKIK